MTHKADFSIVRMAILSYNSCEGDDEYAEIYSV